MNKLFTLLLLFCFQLMAAQIADYSHPPMILGQERISIEADSNLFLGPELLIIHDMDEGDFARCEVLVSDGPNYVLSDNVLSPDSGFSGVLHLEVRVSDGEHESAPYTLKVEVFEAVEGYSYELLGQYPAETEEGISYSLDINQLKVHRLALNYQAHYYVDPDGDDANPGTEDLPLLTLNGAKAKVRSLKTGEGMPPGGISVVFREGDYFISSTVNFDSGDSGEKDAYITYRAYPNEKVRFTGARHIDYEWFEDAPVDILLKIKNAKARGKIKMINLKANGIENYGEIGHVGYVVSNQPISPSNIYVDGKAMHLCRYPNTENFDDVFSHVGQDVFNSRSKVVNTWHNTGDLWIDGALSKPWEWKKNKIQSISPEGIVTMTWDYHSEIGAAEPKMFYFNMIEELDYPEEYFLDRTRGILYFYPPENLDRNSEIRISQSTQKLLNLNGTKYVQFVDVHFEGSRNTGIQLQNGASNNRFINCEISDMGLDGMRVYGTENEIISSHIHDIGANGIYLDGGNQSSMTPARNLVENCKIHDFSQERRAYNPGLTLFGTGQVVRNSEIFNGPHMGMKIKGNNHLLEYNDVHRLPHEYSDMLAIYFNTGNYPLQRGTIIRRNRFHDVSGGWKRSAGVYMDNETCGVLVEENYFYDNGAESSGWSVMVHGGADNIVRNNVFVYASYPFCISLRLNGYASGDFEGRLDRWQSEFRTKAKNVHFQHYPELKHFFDDEGVSPVPLSYTFNKIKNAEGDVINYWDRRTPSTNVFTGNMVYNESPDIFKMSNMDRGFYTVSNFRVIDGQMQENLISGNNHNESMDPGFTDYIGRDLSFDTASINPGLKADLPHLSGLPFYKMGLKDSVGVLFTDFSISPDSLELVFEDVVPENYTLTGNLINPDPDYSGILSVPVRMRAGDNWLSEVFDFKITVLEHVEELPIYINLSPEDTLISKDDTLQLQLELGPGIDPSYVFYLAADPDILSVNQDGEVIGLSGGTTEVYAYSIDQIYGDTVMINVFEEELPKYIIISPHDTLIYVGDTLHYELNIGPGLERESVSVYSEDWYVLSISESGDYIGRKAGKVDFIAHVSDFSFADTIHVKVEEVGTGFVNGASSGNISLYPNPAKETIYVHGVSEKAWYSVISASGSVLRMFNEQRLDLTGLAPGIYLLQVDVNDERLMKHFIKL